MTFLLSVISVWIGILDFYLAVWPEVEQYKCKHDLLATMNAFYEEFLLADCFIVNSIMRQLPMHYQCATAQKQ